MGSIGKGISSALTPPGTNAANTDRDRKSTVQKGARDAFNWINPAFQSSAQFAANVEPLRQRSVWDSIHASTPWGVQGTVDNFRRGAIGDAVSNLPMLQQILSSGGAGIGSLQGAQFGAINDANSRANELMAWYASPAGKQALAQMAQGAFGQAQSMPLGQTVNNLANVIYGRPQPQVGASPLAGITQMGSMLYGAGVL